MSSLDLLHKTTLPQKFIILLFLLFLDLLHANSADQYVDALKLFNQKSYQEAFPSIEKEAKKGNKEAQYLLAQMYEKGLGMQKDPQNASYWYKQAASKYHYIVEENSTIQIPTRANFIQRLKNQLHYTSEQKGSQFAYSKIDSSVPEVKSRFLKILENNFGLLPYQTIYVAPLTYASTTYNRHFSTFLDHQIPTEWQNHTQYDNHVEAEYQFSFQKPMTYDLLGWNESISFSYTQRVWWKLYDESGPFRETNYLPELFMIIPTSDQIDKLTDLKAVKFGYRHHSNGAEGYLSRSWDRLFLSTLWQHKNLFFKAEGWYRIPEKRKSEAYYAGSNPKEKGDDNPDIYRYMGYGDLELIYLNGEDQFNLLVRNNLRWGSNKGAIQIDYTTPFFNSDNTYWYFKIFSGYGESMIDYDRSISKLSIGFAYSRAIF